MGGQLKGGRSEDCYLQIANGLTSFYQNPYLCGLYEQKSRILYVGLQTQLF